MPRVGIIMGSDSDLPVMKEAGDILSQFQVDYEMTVCSAHRLPEETARYASQAQQRGIQVIIAGAGGAAHLPGVIAAYTVLPVIGVPMKTNSLGGVDSLYSIVQMPRGIPVATVAINGAANAGLLAVQILALQDETLHQALLAYRRKMADEVRTKDQRLKEKGAEGYLREKEEQ
ncbi:MAG TPA: 5-(carboxyamino)imidazole ribonucleotide mutase [Syntrophomonadaceae bacterium]|nr:5-(carboxyamino)imidazole ribonucleotide mutase [Syntrophomonadaceae bacterium]HQA07372.1 5-(carboxyamino)imidazole ribonucleotide mutase [Syntrophomonadaceae bacterium]HQE23791.1 5-(carboxyamino)imidazole ribonucleotide mutase [Syntrophomonadaceae bacterium]